MARTITLSIRRANDPEQQVAQTFTATAATDMDARIFVLNRTISNAITLSTADIFLRVANSNDLAGLPKDSPLAPTGQFLKDTFRKTHERTQDAVDFAVEIQAEIDRTIDELNAEDAGDSQTVTLNGT